MNTEENNTETLDAITTFTSDTFPIGNLSIPVKGADDLPFKGFIKLQKMQLKFVDATLEESIDNVVTFMGLYADLAGTPINWDKQTGKAFSDARAAFPRLIRHLNQSEDAAGDADEGKAQDEA